MTGSGRVLVDPGAIQVEHRRVGALPVVNAVLGRLGVDDLLGAYLAEPDPRVGLSSARAIGVLIRNLAVGREPLYGLAAWAAGHEAGLVGVGPGEAALLNDDRVGRALDELFVADRASLMTALSLAAIRTYRIDCSELHNDSTSLALYGAYAGATGANHGGIRPPLPARGHSKDHRPDLKQLVWVLTVSADGAVPLTYRLCDGNTEDSTTHVGTWDRLVSLLGRADFVYVADCKLATRDNLEHIASHHGRLLTVLPRSRKEDERGRAWIAAGEIDWTEIARRAGRRRGDPDEVYWAAEAPVCSEEGLRICWIRSSHKRAIDAAARTDRIERAGGGLDELTARLSAARCRLKTRVAIEQAAAGIVADTGSGRWVRFEVAEHVEVTHRQERRGRPGPNTRFRRIETRRFSLSWSVDAEAVAYDAASDGCFPFITTETKTSPAELLAIYKGQPHLERRHATLKGVIAAAPLTLKSDRRLDAFGFCLYVALLVHALVERQLRRAMAAKNITALPLYPEDRDCKAPTAARVFELLDPLTHTIVRHRDRVLAITDPTLTPLQERLLTLLGTPLGAYRPARP
jgi:transposase